jgi:hypothetical protein
MHLNAIVAVILNICAARGGSAKQSCVSALNLTVESSAMEEIAGAMLSSTERGWRRAWRRHAGQPPADGSVRGVRREIASRRERPRCIDYISNTYERLQGGEEPFDLARALQRALRWLVLCELPAVGYLVPRC